MAVPFTPKGYMDLQWVVLALAEACNPELFSPEDISERGRLLELNRKGDRVPAPDLPPSLASSTPSLRRPRRMSTVFRAVPLTPEEECERDELERREQARTAARGAAATALRQALGDGDLQAFGIIGGHIHPLPAEGWRRPEVLRAMQRYVLPDQLWSLDEASWGVLLSKALFGRWLAGPTAKRAERKQVSPEKLLAWLVEWCGGELRRTGFRPKKPAAVKALQDEFNCDRATARAVQKQLPRHLRFARGNRPGQIGRGNRQ